VWHGLDKKPVLSASPIGVGRLALLTVVGIVAVLDHLAMAVEAQSLTPA
jgi:hypothetical protein